MSEAKGAPTPSGDFGGPPMPMGEPAPARATPPPSGDLGGPPMPMDGGGEEPQREGVLGRLRERAAETLERARDAAAARLPSAPGATQPPTDLDFPETLPDAINAVKSVEDPPPADARRGERRDEGGGEGEAGARAKL